MRVIALRSLVAALCAACCAVVPARADETAAPPSHLAAYNLAWLNYLDPADVPATRYATCLVDSGVRETPDTPADDPAGPIIARLAVDGGSGLPEGESAEQLHGTRMAMAMAAPVNDWGTIGTWTGGGVVSVRATTEGEGGFRPEYYERGINRCIQYMVDHQMPLAAINLSLGCGACALTAEQQAVLEDWIGNAHGFGISVVAAAGNEGGGVQTPASVSGTFAVAGGDSAGGLCGYSSFGAEVAVIGPACPVASADPLTGQPVLADGGGSSAATATTSMLIGALRSLQPAAPWEEAESWVRDSARTVGGHRVLDGEAAAQAAGLGEIVARAEARQAESASAAPTATSTPTALVTPAATAWPGEEVAKPVERAVRLPRPQLAFARFSRGQLTVRTSNRPARSRLMVTAERFKREGFGVRSTRRAIRASGRVRVRTRWRPQRLRLRFLTGSSTDERTPSRLVLLYRQGDRYR